MTEPLYHTDAYLKEFEATVVAVEGNAIALDRTAFYPGGGGQPNDVGAVTAGELSWPVTKVRKTRPDAKRA
ncbi:MAG: alanine--tRNA ligase-related protein, partial [Chloroflexota bacterium]